MYIIIYKILLYINVDIIIKLLLLVYECQY